MISAMPRIAIAVEDFAATMRTFAEDFGMPTVDFSDVTVPDLGANVGMCVPENGSNIEIMAPASPDLALAKSLQRFLDRRGEGLYALMLEAPDPNQEAEGLEQRGLGVLPLMKGAGGRDVHPSSTHGVLIRVYPNNSVGERGNPADRTSSGPMLSGITRVIIATDDVEKAAEVYGTGFGLETGPVVEDDRRGVLAAVAEPPIGGRIELVSVIDAAKPFAARIGDFLAERGQGMYALVLEAGDPAAATAALSNGGATATDPAAAGGAHEVMAFGARFLIE